MRRKFKINGVIKKYLDLSMFRKKDRLKREESFDDQSYLKRGQEEEPILIWSLDHRLRRKSLGQGKGLSDK